VAKATALSTNSRMWGLHALGVLGQHRLADPRHQPLVGDVDPVSLDLRGLLVEEVVELALGVVADRLVGVHQARFRVEPDVPAAGLVAGNGEGAVVERLRVVVEPGEVDVGDGAAPLAARGTCHR
jgi:hypothetical protein